MNRANRHLHLVKGVKNFENLIIVSFLCGWDDLSVDNRGVIEEADGTKKAVLLRYGISRLSVESCLRTFLNNRHLGRKEIVCTPKFAESCVKIVKKFQSRERAIERSFQKNTKIEHSELLPVMALLRQNANALLILSYRIEAEKAQEIEGREKRSISGSKKQGDLSAKAERN